MSVVDYRHYDPDPRQGFFNSCQTYGPGDATRTGRGMRGLAGELDYQDLFNRSLTLTQQSDPGATYPFPADVMRTLHNEGYLVVGDGHALGYHKVNYTFYPGDYSLQVAWMQGKLTAGSIPICSGLYSATTDGNGVLTPGESVVHCMSFPGFTDVSSWMIARNMLGPSFGINGFGYIPYSYFNPSSPDALFQCAGAIDDIVENGVIIPFNPQDQTGPTGSPFARRRV